MRSLNRVMLIGHLAANPELRQTKNGHTVVSFPMATNRILRSLEGGKRELTDFHRILAWDKLGQICGNYLVKGMAVYIEGRLFPTILLKTKMVISTFVQRLLLMNSTS